MKLAQVSALSAAIFLATSAQANAFLEDSSLNIGLKNFYMKKTKDVTKEDTTSQWAQGIQADFESGYFEGIVGLDVSAYYSLKLGASDIASAGNPGLLQGDTDGDSKSYGKTAYAIKFNLADMGVAKYGRLKLDTPLLNDSGSRVLPSLSEAFYADLAHEGLSGYAVLAKKANAKTEAGFDDYGTDADSESVKAFGAAYDFGNGLALSANYATQAEFAKKYLTEVTYATEVDGIDLGVAAQYAKNTHIGDNKSATDDNDQTAYGLKVSASMGNASVGLAYTKVEKTDIDGFTAGWNSVDKQDDTGYFGYNSIQYSDFNNNGEKAWGLNASYDFSEVVEGLEAGVTYVKGDYEGGDEKEVNVAVSYAIPQVEGLSASLKYAKNDDEKDGGAETTVTDTRLVFKYNVAVF